LLEVRSLKKRYGPIVALRGVSLRLEPGEILGLIGPNGAGKTSLIKSVMGIVVPDAGEILVDGVPAASPRGKRLLAYSPEAPIGPSWARVCELLERLAWIEGVPSGEARRQARRAAEALGLEGLCDRRLGWLSKGQRKRVMIAQALLPEAKKYYLLDEPLTGLDPEWVARTREIIVQLARSGAGVLVSSHILRELEAVVNKVAIIRRGQLVFYGTLDELASRVGQRPVLVLRVGDISGARSVLEGLGYRPVLEGGAAIRVDLDSVEDADRIIDALRKAGVKLLGYEVKEASLEDAYLRLVSGEVSGSA